jgi:histidinol dehydrogenase|tara:strand:+ start:1588 stop:2853 length:1266 start_codon:yes stop_codon:yes gene_type:complete
MIKEINCKNSNFKKKLKNFLEKRRSGKTINTSIVLKIIKDIKKNKLKALIKYEKKFSKNTKIKPSKKEINQSIKNLDPKIKKAIDFAYSRIFKFHSMQRAKNIKYVDQYKNQIEYKHIPIQKVGVYVPANLPSTLLMNVIPAKLAGVKRVVVANPLVNGRLNAAVMYAAKKCNVNEVITCGGAQAIGSLAYIQKVNKITGPGNDYVAKAKQLVFGDVGVEGMIAGPSEICILADNKTEINEITTSILGQSEHDENSQSILITKYKDLITKVKKDIKVKLKKLPRKKIISKSLNNHGLLVLCQNDNQIIDLINEIAPEHLELNISNANKYINKIFNAGSICIGKYSPMAVTDYNAGSNHTLPTLGSAKFSSGLNLSEFYKKISYINLSKKGVEKIGESAIHLANYEGLTAHMLSIKSRMRRK